MRPLVYGLIIILLAFSVSAAVIDPDSSSPYNSQTYRQNYLTMLSEALQSPYNTTLSFTNGGTTYLTVPEYDSSTECAVPGNLVTTYTGSPNSTLYEIRSDLFSEVGIGLSMGDNATAMHQWYNTLIETMQCDGGLPCWVIQRNGTAFEIPGNASNDTAIDGTVRVGQALYVASANVNFSITNRTTYKSLADQIAAGSYQYETISINPASTSGGTVERLPFGGANVAAAGIGSTDPHFWIGYCGDVIRFNQMAYYSTSNETYNNAARNFTAACEAVSVQNDTAGNGFGVAPFNFRWDNSSGTINHSGGGGVNSYHYNKNNEQWDDSDAPRHYLYCDVLRTASLTTGVNGAYSTASTYCQDWTTSNTMTNSTSCLQYYYNGTCAVSITSGFYQNGFGGLAFTYHNTTKLDDKLNEALSHYSFGGGTYDSTACGTALSYRGIRPLKLLGLGMGLDERFFSTSTIDPTVISASIEELPYDVNNPLEFYCTGDSLSNDVQYDYKIYQDGAVLIDTSTNFTDDFNRSDNSSVGNGWVEGGWNSPAGNFEIQDQTAYAKLTSYGGATINRTIDGLLSLVSYNYTPAFGGSYSRIFMRIGFMDSSGNTLGILESRFSGGVSICSSNTTTSACNQLGTGSWDNVTRGAVVNVTEALDNVLTGIDQGSIDQYNVMFEVSQGIGSTIIGVIDNVTMVYQGLTGNYTEGQSANVANYSGLSIGQEYLLSCRAYNGTIFSDWTNSSTITVTQPVTFNLVDGSDGSSLSGTNVTVTLTSDMVSDTIWSTTGTIIYNFTTEEYYSIGLSASGYDSNTDEITISTATPSGKNLSLFVANDTTTVTMLVTNELGQVVENATIEVRRYQSSTNSYPIVQTVTTNFEGEAVAGIILNENDYRFRILVDGSEKLYTVPSPVHDTALSFSIVVGSSPGTSISNTTGISVRFTPEYITMGSYETFMVTVTSDYYTLENISFFLYNGSNSTSILNETFASASGGGASASVGYLIGTNTTYIATVIVGLEEFSISYSRYYESINTTNTNYTLEDAFDSLGAFSGSGFGRFNKLIISLIVMTLLTLTVASKTDVTTQPEVSLFFLFTISLLFSYINWLNLSIPGIPLESLNQYLISLVLGLATFGVSMRRWGVFS